MNQLFTICRPQTVSPEASTRKQRGFTLIEMLVVIGIIGLLSALIVGTVSLAGAKRSQALAESQREALITAIESYHKARGFYPQDNTNDTVQTPLFYELTGTITTFVGGQPKDFYSPISTERLSQSSLLSLFGVSGFINTSNSVDNPSQNFYPGLKFNQHEIVVGNGGNYTVLGCAVDGPLRLSAAPNTSGNFLINPWHYNSSHPTNNVDSYDLWMDVKYSGKTNRICNWSKDPVLVNY